MQIGRYIYYCVGRRPNLYLCTHLPTLKSHITPSEVVRQGLESLITCLDELEKMSKKDQTSLLNLMESGILSELKHNQKRSTQLKTWVFASCNNTDKLLLPLLSRFRDIHFKPYTEEEFVEIVVNVLDREEGIDRDIALLIADGVYNRLKSSNIRECVRIAKLARNDSAQVNRIINTFAKYGMK
jgi:holliday junction DNA helicase RuvB